MRILSDCNTVFINHMLKGARINTQVTEVMTNLSSFIRCQPDSESLVSSSSSNIHFSSAQQESASDSDTSQLSSLTKVDSASDLGDSASSMADSASNASESSFTVAKSPSRVANSAKSLADTAPNVAESAQQAMLAGTWAIPNQGATSGLPPASHKLVVQPRHDYTQTSHGCPMCPANLCKVSQ